MSLAALDRLAAAQEELIRALDGSDLRQIENAVTALSGAIAGVREADAVALQPHLAERLARLSGLAQAAQMRVNYLTDRMNGRLAELAALRGQAGPIAYQPGTR